MKIAQNGGGAVDGWKEWRLEFGTGTTVKVEKRGDKGVTELRLSERAEAGGREWTWCHINS